MSEILLRAEDAASAASFMRDRKDTAAGEFTSTKNKLTELAGSFKGKTADAFQVAFDDWHTNANGLLEALNNLSVFLDNAANAIVETDANIASQLGG